MVAHADARVVAFRDDVGEPVVEQELDLDVRILRSEAFQLRPQDMADGVVRRDDPDRSRGLLPLLVQGIDLDLDLVEMRADPFQKPLACFCRRGRPRGAREQADAEPRLELAEAAE